MYRTLNHKTYGKGHNMLVSDIDKIIAGELGVRREQVAKAIELLDDGNTVPFIARYRKEATGALEDEQLRTLAERLDYLRGLAKRQEENRNKLRVADPRRARRTGPREICAPLWQTPEK